jgi:hypothetical protein
MIIPIDGWTLVHGLIGFFSERIKIRRIWLYPLPFIWEVYQYFFHYQPLGKWLEDVWLNSIFDIAIFLLFYELARWYNLNFDNIWLFQKLTNEVKATMVYILVSLGLTWLFWDDIFRLKLAGHMSNPQIPLLFGALSPFMASLIIRKWFNHGEND